MSRKSPHPQPASASDEADDAVIARAFKGSLAVIVCVAVMAGAAAWWLRPKAVPVAKDAEKVVLPEQRSAPAVQLPALPFQDITSAVGITFVHEAGATGEKLLPETMGSGCLFFDYNNDGHQDLLLVNSANNTSLFGSVSLRVSSAT